MRRNDKWDQLVNKSIAYTRSRLQLNFIFTLILFGESDVDNYRGKIIWHCYILIIN